MSINKSDYIAAYRQQVSEREFWDAIVANTELSQEQRTRAAGHAARIQHEINELYSALIADGVSHKEIRGE